MTLEQIGILVSLATGVGGPLLTAVLFSFRYGKLELKVDTMWSFQMHRAAASLVTQGHGTIESPLTISPALLAKFDTLKEQLRTWYQRLGRYDATDADLMLQLERAFGDAIVKTICIPMGVNQGECLIIAAAIAKGNNVIDV